MEKRIVLIGAGSAQFGYGTIGDILQSKTLEGSHIVLHDINPNTLKAVEQSGLAFIAEHKLAFTLSATTQRKEALQGADFVINSIEVGNRFDLWEQDWRIPQQFGIRQVYGENGGPGGLFHALRIIPPILDICADVLAICPGAWVFNYSNPMSRICTTVYRAFPALKFVGLCHEIGSLSMFLPLILGVPYEALDIRAGGLNHFSCVLSAKYKDSGQDAYPDIREKAPKFFGNMPSLNKMHKYFKETGQWPEKPEDFAHVETEAWPERHVFQVILQKFGLLPITSDSHFGEYIPWAYDVTDHKGILDFYQFYKEFLSQERPSIQLRLSERVVPIIEGIVTNSGYEEAAVNIPNGLQGKPPTAGGKRIIDNLPDWMVVEAPATVNADGVYGIPLGDLPQGFAGLLTNQIGVHALTADAVIHKSKTLALQALLVDPIVGQYDGLEAMLDTMIEYQRPWLGYLK